MVVKILEGTCSFCVLGIAVKFDLSSTKRSIQRHVKEVLANWTSV
jgi:hypothetical protein